MKTSLTQKDLVENLVERGVVKSPNIIKAMEKVDRKYYCPKMSYSDSPQ
jgi:protein-L-isoaspartate O-methyltransferase